MWFAFQKFWCIEKRYGERRLYTIQKLTPVTNGEKTNGRYQTRPRKKARYPAIQELWASSEQDNSGEFINSNNNNGAIGVLALLISAGGSDRWSQALHAKQEARVKPHLKNISNTYNFSIHFGYLFPNQLRNLYLYPRAHVT
jgi:hypothetical protein